MATRQELEERVRSNGAEYRGDLNKEVTHLIAYSATGLKYRFARQWGGIHVVALEWLEQSIERGMALDETLYDPLTDPSERGRGAWKQKLDAMPKRKRSSDSLAPAGAQSTLRRTASAKFDSQNDGMWTDIVGAENKPRQVPKSDWDESSDSVAEVFLDAEPGTEASKKAVGYGSDDTSLLPRPASRQGVFAGKSFYLHGFGPKEVIARLLFPCFYWR